MSVGVCSAPASDVPVVFPACIPGVPRFCPQDISGLWHAWEQVFPAVIRSARGLPGLPVISRFSLDFLDNSFSQFPFRMSRRHLPVRPRAFLGHPLPASDPLSAVFRHPPGTLGHPSGIFSLSACIFLHPPGIAGPLYSPFGFPFRRQSRTERRHALLHPSASFCPLLTASLQPPDNLPAFRRPLQQGLPTTCRPFSCFSAFPFGGYMPHDCSPACPRRLPYALPWPLGMPHFSPSCAKGVFHAMLSCSMWASIYYILGISLPLFFIFVNNSENFHIFPIFFPEIFVYCF